MIYDKKKDNKIISSFEGKSTVISDVKFIKQIISDNLYSDKIGSVVREIRFV